MKWMITGLIHLLLSGSTAAQVVVDMPPPAEQPAQQAQQAPSSGAVALAGYAGRAQPYAVYGSRPGGYLNYGYRYRYPYYYGFGFGFPFIFIGHGHHHHHHHGRDFHSGSGAILGHFSKHGSNLTVDFDFPP